MEDYRKIFPDGMRVVCGRGYHGTVDWSFDPKELWPTSSGRASIPIRQDTERGSIRNAFPVKVVGPEVILTVHWL